MSEAEQTDTGREEIWLEQYRPRTFDEIVGQDTIVDRLRSYVRRDDLPHMLFAGPAGVGKCATGETPVLTSDGLARIEDVVGETDGFAKNEDGTEILTLTEGGEFEYAEPSHVFSRTAEDHVAVSTRDGSELTVTPEHRLLVVTNEGFEWREAESIEPGDRIVRPLDVPVPETVPELHWIEKLDGERTFVHVTSEFADRYEIPVEENLTGRKKEIVGRLRQGATVGEIVANTDIPRGTVQAAKREFQQDDLESPSTVCSLAHLRELRASEEELREHVEQIQYVTRYNKRSEPITPPWKMTPELAELVGLAISEARIGGGQVKFYNTTDRLCERFERILREQFSVEPRRGKQKGVPYVDINNRTLTHYLESCFDVFASAMGENAIGSTLLHADAESRRSFLRAVFDAEAHVTKHGILELTQKNGAVITLLSYLLATFGIPSRRKQKQKMATNGTRTERTYHTLYISGAPHLERFASKVGFSVNEKADRLATAASKTGNPNDDTVPTQEAVNTLCRQLNLKKHEYIPESLNPDSAGRRRYLDGVSDLIDAATERFETIQKEREHLTRLEPVVDEIASIPARWVDARDELEPLAMRRQVRMATGIRKDRLLEYSRGDRTPYTNRVRTLLSEITGEKNDAPIQTLQSELGKIIGRLGVPYEQIATGTEMRGPEVANLLDNDEHEIRSLSRFVTVTERLDEILSDMASMELLQNLRTLDRLVKTDLYLDEVESVERVDSSQRVYDLTVPGTRNYVAGTVPTVMHNTTASVTIARELYGAEWEEHFLELNASDERGIDVVRDRIKSFARTSFGGVDYRIIFLDEADALCVPPGTEVVTGYPSSPEVKKIEDVDESGEPIPSVDFETNEIQSDTGRLVDSGVADFFELELADGRTVTASLTHPFFVVGEDGTLVERELRELTPGDEIADFRDDIGVSPRDEELPHHEHYDREEFEPGLVADGGLRTVQTVEVRSIEYSHRGKAYNISMENTPNFMLANGILTHNTSDAQSALRRTMEQFSNNVRFILSCNYSSQIIDPIQSRCAVFRFSPLSDEAVGEQVRKIASAEGIEVTEDGVEALVYAADGDMRKAINGLQAAAVTDGPVDEAAVFEITSTARPEEIEEMVTRALEGDFTAARSRLDRLVTEEGIAGGDIIDQMHRSVWEFDLGDEAAVRLLDRIGEADYRITEGANERIQLEALLASLALDA